MNEHLPYEDELKKQLEILPLPEEDIAWEDMKRRLEKDGKDRPVLPPLFKGCGCYGLVFLLLLIACWFIMDPLNWLNTKTAKTTVKTGSVKNNIPKTDEKINADHKLSESKKNNKTILKDSLVLARKSIGSSKIADNIPFDKNKTFKSRTFNGKQINAQMKNINVHKKIKATNYFKDQSTTIDVKKNYKKKPDSKRINKEITDLVADDISADTAIGDSKIVNNYKEEQALVIKDSINNITSKPKPGLDSFKKEAADLGVDKRKLESDTAKENSIYFGAGLGVHQLIPIAGQKSNPYNSLGRKSSLADYVPSAYVRMYKDKKWFIQSEFRYGAPQYTKEIPFIQTKISDTSGPSVTSLVSRLKKTFYHQLPVTFNYFVTPDFSLGAGAAFNKFSSAIVQQDVFRTQNTIQDSLISSGLVSQKKADSNFVTSYMQALIEAQYRWKRFSAGAKYSFGLQPYLKFKLSGGEQREEKNSSLQIFLRYELWRSRKK